MAWFAENMLWASAAMLLVLAIRRPVASLFGAGISYALWLIPAVRLIAPPGEWLTMLSGTSLPSLPPLLVTIDLAGEAAPPSLGGPGQWVPILLAIWTGGALLFLAVQAVRYRRFRGRIDASAQAVGRHRGIPVLASAGVDGPLALGLLKRRIVVPVEFQQRYSPEERALALDHERHHHARGDILANHLALLVLALNWFNPVAWLAFRAFRADQELSCDAAIAATAPAAMRSDYARALVKSASRPGLIAACPLNHADQLKRRLKMLNHHRKDRRRLWAGGAVTASLVAGSLLSGTAGYAQDKAGEPERSRVIVLESREGAAPPTGERREFRMRRSEDGKVRIEGLDPELSARLERCESEQGALSVIGDGNERTRIMVCNKEGQNPANRAEILQKVRERISNQADLSAEAKQRLLAEIDRVIGERRN
jgi:beta-lactamase regulating signal transducer with metallopeptidase domain